MLFNALGNTLNRRLQAIRGALLGDAIGTPFEFARAEALPALAEITLPPPTDFPRAHRGAPACAWSDDGAQMLCLTETLLDGKGNLDVALFASRLLNWRDSGRHQADGVVFDCGIQTDQALDRLRAGVPAHLAGGDGCGNGALMRVLPVALLCGDDALQVACRQCMPTHGAVLVQACCAAYVAMAKLLLETPALPFQVLLPWALDAVDRTATPEMREALIAVERHVTQAMPCGRGYVLDSLRVACWSLERSSSYLEAVRLAISIGGDTDSNACIVGGLAALRFGDVPADLWARVPVPEESREVLSRL